MQLLPNPGRRSEDLGSLPLSTEGSCPNARRGGTYSELAATKDATKIPEGPDTRALETGCASPYTRSPAASCTPAGTSGVLAKARIPKGRKGSEVRICPPAPKSQSRKLRPCFRERTGIRSPRARPQSEPRLAGRPPRGVSGEAGGPALGDGQKRTQKPDTREANGSPLPAPSPGWGDAPSWSTHTWTPASRSPGAPLQEGAARLPLGVLGATWSPPPAWANRRRRLPREDRSLVFIPLKLCATFRHTEGSRVTQRQVMGGAFPKYWLRKVFRGANPPCS